ncbi:MAG: tetratricopeptide repeat protein [bacterium]|nr:outer membrane protein assembly factor BamD [Candidatus Sumerlaeota bacterium]
MHEDEIHLFAKAIEAIRGGFFLDAIVDLETLYHGHPDSDLSDDALYNIAKCYFEVNQFAKALEAIDTLLTQYPQATISALENAFEFGRTAAKAQYLKVLCLLSQRQVDMARNAAAALSEHSDSYILDDGRKLSFADLAAKALETYESMGFDQND